MTTAISFHELVQKPWNLSILTKWALDQEPVNPPEKSAESYLAHILRLADAGVISFDPDESYKPHDLLNALISVAGSKKEDAKEEHRESLRECIDRQYWYDTPPIWQKPIYSFLVDRINDIADLNVEANVRQCITWVVNGESELENGMRSEGQNERISGGSSRPLMRLGGTGLSTFYSGHIRKSSSELLAPSFVQAVLELPKGQAMIEMAEYLHQGICLWQDVGCPVQPPNSYPRDWDAEMRTRYFSLMAKVGGHYTQSSAKDWNPTEKILYTGNALSMLDGSMGWEFDDVRGNMLPWTDPTFLAAIGGEQFKNIAADNSSTLVA